MRVGSVVRARNLRVIFDDGKSWVDYHPTEKGKLYVVLVLGLEDRHVSKEGAEVLDPIAVLRDLGWKPPKGLKPRDVRGGAP